MGAARKRSSGKWEARWYDDAGVQHSKTGFLKRKDAEDFIRTKEAARVAGELADHRKARTPFGSIAEEWYADAVRRRRKPSTLAGYRQILDRYLLPAFGSTPIGKIDTARVRRWLAAVQGAKGSELSDGTRKNIVRVMSAVYTLAIGDGYVKASPTRALRLPKARGPEMLCLTPRQVARLARTIGEPWDVLVYFAAYTGMRSGELCALRVRDLDLLRRKVTVRASVTDVGGKLHWGPPKNDRPRSFGIPAWLAEMVARNLVGRANDPQALVFVSETGRMLRHGNFYRRSYRPAVEAAFQDQPELHGLRFHDLRHTCAAILIAEGVHPKAISERLGHASISITMDRYGHLFDGHDDGLMARLENVFSAAIEAEDRDSRANVVTLG